ncbi:toprim domain-containing protein [Lactococcus muris]|uniref:Toprim domain-containing protein n=1 Tax=Lactococcus muris TaxID=2941330 RepID=A0ABV4D952_9LACT
MSNYKLVTINPKFIAETVARTGSEELMDKATRSYVGLYDENTNWYIPLRANLGKKKPVGTFFETPFSTTNRHFIKPGLDFQKAIYVPFESIIEIDNTLPQEQNILINDNYEKIQAEFEKYVLNVEKYSKDSRDYLWSTVPLFPEGIKKIKHHIKITSNRDQEIILEEQDDKQEITHKPTQQRSEKYTSSSIHITDEMKQQAKNTSILDYVKYYSIPVRRTSGSEYELVDRKNVKFDTRKNLFKDYNPSSNAGGDIIDFAKYIDDVNFPQAIQKIMVVDGSGRFDFYHVQAQPFMMPQIFEEDGRLNEAMIYLVNERKLESSTVKKVAESGLIKQTKNKEVAFIWADGSEDVGMTLQGTKPLEYETRTFEGIDKEGVIKTAWIMRRKGMKEPLAHGLSKNEEEAQEAGKRASLSQRQYKKQIWRNSSTGHGFNFRSGPIDSETQGKMVFTEAAIDTLSYFELKGHQFDRDTRIQYQSLEGLKESILHKSMERYEKRYGKMPEEIILAVDNDEAGDVFVKKVLSEQKIKNYQSKGGKVTREKPILGKDWNEQLQYVKSGSRSHKQNKEVQRSTQL